MKSFKLYTEETKKYPYHDQYPITSLYEEFIKMLSGEPFRLKLTIEGDPDRVTMVREIKLADTFRNLVFRGYDQDMNLMVPMFPYNNTNLPSVDTIYSKTKIFAGVSITPKFSCFYVKKYNTHFINMLLDKPDIREGEDIVDLKTEMMYIGRTFSNKYELFNYYETLQGTEVEKFFIIAERVGIDRIKLLNLKKELGILKHEEIGDEDMIGML